MVGYIGEADPDFGAVENVRVAVLAGCGGDVARVGTGARLGQAEGCQLLASCLRDEVLLLLLFGSPLEQAERVEADVDALDNPKRSFSTLYLLADETESDVVEARTAVLFRYRPS